MSKKWILTDSHNNAIMNARKETKERTMLPPIEGTSKSHSTENA